MLMDITLQYQIVSLFELNLKSHFSGNSIGDDCVQGREKTLPSKTIRLIV